MEVPNLLLNVNVDDAIGQSSVLQHLLTYSYDTGTFPQKISDIGSSTPPNYIWKEVGYPLIGLPSLIPNHRDIVNDVNYLQSIKDSLVDKFDIELNPILNSEFKFCLPGSMPLGNLAETNPDQCMYFAKQTGPLYIYDYNVRTEKYNTVTVCEENLNTLNRYYNLDAPTFLVFLSKMGRKINKRMPSQASNFIQDKPLTLVDMALEHGLEYAQDEGLNTFTKNFLSVDTADEINDIKNVTVFEISQLTDSISGSREYYKYMCDSLNILPNLELFNEFHGMFVKADTKDRLKTITRSEFLTDILCNETNKN